ncbi:hypothetical protein BLNAU_9602 [Blattamonas nauphoetae]|uniref:Protein kinase domain-containing protein n=1 Tax=Blattamonas nauphoetae TaxID=2049346 RepID=A0ABQ9XV68_9EUKA|nr:hypothetical protein BLNAU_9602 [Blattamonas nauphoetae]
MFQPILTITSQTTTHSNLQSLLDTIPNIADHQSNQIQATSIPGGTYIGDNIEIKDRRLELSGEQSNKKSSPGTHIIPQSGSVRRANEEEFLIHTDENCIFSLANSTLSLESLHFSLVTNSEEGSQQINKAHLTRLAIVSSSSLTISDSNIAVSSGTSSILISASTFEESSVPSSVTVKKCSISSENGQLRGLVETAAFPDCQGSRSISVVGCSFNSQGILGTDGIGLSLTQTAQKQNEEVGMISSSLIGCSFMNMSSIGSSRQPQLSHLSQKMLGCVVSLTSSHLSGSTIRDVNNGGSVFCSNSSFSSPNTDTNAKSSITYPNGTSTQFVGDGTVYNFTSSSGNESTFAIFSHCRFTGDKYPTHARPLSFKAYPGTISITSCSFTDLTVMAGYPNGVFGGAVCVDHQTNLKFKPVCVEKSNFTNIKASVTGSGMSIFAQQSVTIDECRFEECGPANTGTTEAGGLYLQVLNDAAVSTVTNLVLVSCFSYYKIGAMYLNINGLCLLSDWLFDGCSSSGSSSPTASAQVSFQTIAPTAFTRIHFTDCQSSGFVAGLYLTAGCDIVMTDFRFLRCTTANEHMSGDAGGLYGYIFSTKTLTVKDCSFVECSSGNLGGAFTVSGSGSCVISDCLVKDCFSGESGAIRFDTESYYQPSSISLTRVAFVNNSVGQNEDSSFSMNSVAETTVFVDACLNYIDGNPKPTISIVECFTTCAPNSIGMLMTVNSYTPEESTVRVDDDEFKKMGPLLTEAVELSFDPLTGRMELEMKGKMPIASQKYEVTIKKEGDKTDVKGVIEFVNGKGTLTSPSPSLTLDYSTSYTITSIVGIVPPSSSSLSNALTFPQAAWAFNLASTPSFVSFTTPEQPPTLIGAKAQLVSKDQPLASVILMLSEEVTGSYVIVVEEEGNDIAITVEFDEPSKMGVSPNFVVVGEDRLLTHNTTYTIKSITPSPDSESPFVWMNETITFHIPESSYVPPQEPEEPDPEDPEEPKPEPEDPTDPKKDDDKKALSPEMKTLLSWLIPLVACLLIALVLAVVIIVLLRRRKNKAETSLKEMEERTDEQVEGKVEVEGFAPENTNGQMLPQALSHSNFGPDNSLFPTEVGRPQSSKDDGLEDLVEVMKCSGDFAVSTTLMDTTLYSAIHTEKRDLRNREIGVQIVNGLKQVVARRGRSDVLTQLSSHWILLDSAGNVHLKLDMNSSEAEQAALFAQMQQDPNAVGAEGEKCEMDGLRWRAPEVATGSGQVDGHKASVFSLGLILWELETGVVPYGEVDAIVAQKQSGTGIPPNMSDLHDEEFVTMLTRCLSVNPKERPTLTEVGEFLSSHKNNSAAAESRNDVKTQLG